MEPQNKQTLASFIMAAKVVIYDANRMRDLLPMMDTPDGAIQAVQTIIGAIEQKKQIPPDVAPLLGMSVYMLMVDMAHNVTGEQPDPGIVKSVIGKIMGTLATAYRGQKQRAGQTVPPRNSPAPPRNQGTPPAGGIIQQKAMA